MLLDLLDPLVRAHQDLFLALNPGMAADGGVPPLVRLARFASTALPHILLAGLLGGLLAGPAWLRRRILLMLAAMAIAWLAVRAVQALWPQPRPFMRGMGVLWLPHAPSPGFPSMHAAVAAVFAASFWWPGLGGAAFPAALIALVVAVLIAWSRVALGHHFPVDVALGLLMGVAAAAGLHAGLRTRWLRGLSGMGRRRLRRLGRRRAAGARREWAGLSTLPDFVPIIARHERRDEPP